jgi:hypothetical protein
MLPARIRPIAAVLALALPTLFVAACGDDDEETSSKPTTMSITTTDAPNKRFKMTAPKSIEGGVVKVNFTNSSKVPHEAQIVRLDGGHTAQEALDVVEPEKVVLPEWFRAEGGVGTTPPGKSGTATVKLPAGTYGVIDTESDDGGPPPSEFGALATFKVTGDNGAELKDTSAKIETRDKGKDYDFVTSGLKAGTNNLTFDNPSKEIHHVLAVPINGTATLAQVEKFFATMGEAPGPPPVNFEKAAGTAVLDGKRKETTRFELQKGRTVLICFLTDRDGKGKSHPERGMLEEINVP